jgi:heme acquisition protein HasR
MHRYLLLSMVFASLILTSPAWSATSNTDIQEVMFDVPEQPLEQALTQAARQADLSIDVEQSLLAKTQAPALLGSFSVQEAFERLLAGSGLTFSMNGKSLLILRKSDANTSEKTFPTVVVTGKRDPKAEIYETPEMRSSVTSEDLRRLPARNTRDTLANVSGVFTSQGRSDPGISVNIWGMQDFGRVNVMIDGTRQNFQKSGHGSNGQVYLDPALLSGVDISKGPNSKAGGAGMIAGMVNFKTLEIQDVLRDDQKVGGRIEASTGTNATHFLGNVATGIRLENNSDLFAAVSRRHIGDFRLGKKGGWDRTDNAGFAMTNRLGTYSKATSQDSWSGLIKYGWKPADGHRLQLSYTGLDTDFSNGEGGISEMSTVSGKADYKVRTDTLKLEYDWKPHSQWVELESSLYYTSTRRDEFRDQSTVSNPNNTFIQIFETHTVGGSAQNTALIPLDTDGSWQLKSLSGGEFFYDWTRPSYSDQVALDTTTRDPSWYSGSTPEGDRTVASIFQSFKLNYQQWLELGAGIRYDQFWLDGAGQFYVGQVTNGTGSRPATTRIFTGFEVDRSAYAFSPTLSLALKPSQWAQFFVNYAEGMRPPAITETLLGGMHSGNLLSYLPNPGLKEERAHTWQFGINLNLNPQLLRKDSLRIKAAWFENRVSNYIIQGSVVSPVATSVSCSIYCSQGYVNLKDPAHFRGLDLQLDYDSDRIFGNLNITRTISDINTQNYDPFPLGSWTGYPDTILGTSASTALTNTFWSGPPRLKIGLSGGIRLFEKKLELGARWRFERPFKQETLGSSWDQEIVRTLDLWVGYQLSRNLRLGLAVDNVLDRNYIEITGSGTVQSFAPGRTILGTMSVHF